jgi:hypothetical protein
MTGLKVMLTVDRKIATVSFGSIASSNDRFQRAARRFAVLVDPDAVVLRD